MALQDAYDLAQSTTDHVCTYACPLPQAPGMPQPTFTPSVPAAPSTTGMPGAFTPSMPASGGSHQVGPAVGEMAGGLAAIPWLPSSQADAAGSGLFLPPLPYPFFVVFCLPYRTSCDSAVTHHCAWVWNEHVCYVSCPCLSVRRCSRLCSRARSSRPQRQPLWRSRHQLQQQAAGMGHLQPCQAQQVGCRRLAAPCI